MTVTVARTHFQKQKPKIINCDYKNFSESDYRQQILYGLSLLSNAWGEKSFECFLGICKETPDKTAPIKKNVT